MQGGDEGVFSIDYLLQRQDVNAMYLYMRRLTPLRWLSCCMLPLLLLTASWGITNHDFLKWDIATQALTILIIILLTVFYWVLYHVVVWAMLWVYGIVHFFMGHQGRATVVLNESGIEVKVRGKTQFHKWRSIHNASFYKGYLMIAGRNMQLMVFPNYWVIPMKCDEENERTLHAMKKFIDGKIQFG